MCKKYLIRLLPVILLSLTGLFAQSSLPVQPLSEDQLILTAPVPIIDKSSHNVKLSSELNTLYTKYTRRESLTDFADRAGLKIEGNSVEVSILFRRGFDLNQNIIEQIEPFGINIKATSQHSILAQVPMTLLNLLVDRFPGIAQIRRPMKPLETAVTSEGVDLMNVDAWHSEGHEGAGVKVAVIDGGFNQLTAAQTEGDIPTSYNSHDFTGTGLQTGSSHGTAVAEAIYDVAPQAELYLYKIGTYTDYENAKDYCISNGVHIVNHSMGWFNAGGYYDGTGHVCDVAIDAMDNDILWVNSAGNQAENHYRAVFDPDGDDFHIFESPSVNINPIGPEPGFGYFHSIGDVVNMVLSWDNYPTTDQDYDLHLYRYNAGDWTLVASSINEQSGSTSPEESIYYENTIENAVYGVRVHKYSATSNADFTLFSLELGLSYHTTSSSIVDPATVTDVITVGAIDRVNYVSGPQQDFSSLGPTTDGRIKPDIMAPDNCISYAYGYWNGTSLASPHTAGVCAVIKSSSPGYSKTQIKDYLYNDVSIDLGDPGKDNIYGWGKIGLSDNPLPVMLIDFSASSYENSILLEWTTASELNNAYWIIEKKPLKALPENDTVISDSLGEYIELARVEGKGNTNNGSYYQLIDNDVVADQQFSYRLYDVSYGGQKTYQQSILAMHHAPMQFRLHQNYPNPFNPSTMIEYSIPKSSKIEISIHNLTGQKLKTLVNKSHTPGDYRVTWDGSGYAAGVYIYQINADNFVQSKKMLLIK